MYVLTYWRASIYVSWPKSIAHKKIDPPRITKLICSLDGWKRKPTLWQNTLKFVSLILHFFQIIKETPVARCWLFHNLYHWKLPVWQVVNPGTLLDGIQLSRHLKARPSKHDGLSRLKSPVSPHLHTLNWPPAVSKVIGFAPLALQNPDIGSCLEVEASGTLSKLHLLEKSVQCA